MRARVQWLASLRRGNTRTPVRCLAAMMALAGSAAAAVDPTKTPLDGTWQAVAAVIDGNEESEDEVRPYQLELNGDKFVISKSGEMYMKGSFKVDASKKPPHLDLKIEAHANESSDLVGRKLLGIYELKADRLTWCYTVGGDNRPKELKPASGHVLATYKRVKK